MLKNIHQNPIGLQSFSAFAWGEVCPSSNHFPDVMSDFEKFIRLRYEHLCP